MRVMAISSDFRAFTSIAYFLQIWATGSFAREFLVWQDLFAYLTEMSAMSVLLYHSLHPCNSKL